MRPPNLASLLSARGVHLPVRPFQSRSRAVRFGCAAAAGSIYAVGVGKLRRHNSVHAHGVRRSSVLPSDFGSEGRRVTDSLLVLNAVMFAAQWLSKDVVTIWGIQSNMAIAKGDYFRLITPTFLHGNILHLLLNSLALNNLGPMVEKLSGHGRFAAVYGAAAIAGSTTSFFFSKADLSLGSSGAIFGVGGALAMFFYRHKEFFGESGDAVLRNLGQNLAINLVYGLVASNINNWCHMGGLAGGALTAYLLGPRYVRRKMPGGKEGGLVDVPPISRLTNNSLSPFRLSGAK